MFLATNLTTNSAEITVLQATLASSLLVGPGVGRQILNY